MKLGEKLKDIRIGRHLNQNTVAEAIGITKSALSQIKNNVTSPKIDTLNKLLDFYCIDKESFIATGKECLDISFYTDVAKDKALKLHNEQINYYSKKCGGK